MLRLAAGFVSPRNLDHRQNACRFQRRADRVLRRITELAALRPALGDARHWHTLLGFGDPPHSPAAVSTPRRAVLLIEFVPILTTAVRAFQNLLGLLWRCLGHAHSSTSRQTTICPHFERLNSKSSALVAPGEIGDLRQYAEGG
jgi:hypothetical protein